MRPDQSVPINEGLSIIIPALDEETAIGAVIDGLMALLPEICPEFEILVVNDGSRDRTALVAAEQGALVISHPRNRGYGASLKTGIRKAKFPLIAMLDADGQHDAAQLADLLAHAKGTDMVIGQRTAQSHAPLLRRPGKLILKWVANWITGSQIPDLNSGLRVVRREAILQHLSIAPDGFSFSTTTTIAFLQDGLMVQWVPIKTHKRTGRKSSVNILRDGFNTLLLIIRMVVLFAPLRVFLPVSGLFLLLGGYGAIVGILDNWNIGDKEVIVILSGIMIFFYGILADQLSAIRRELRR